MKKLILISAAALLSLFALNVPTTQASTAYPVRLIVPSIGLDVPIQKVGLNSKGEMAVPSGSSGKVGWYQQGTIPGDLGSAVLDAHVYAVFSKLKYLRPGSDIYVVNQDNVALHFIVSQMETNLLGAISADTLFNLKDAKRLNLITCAGAYIPALGTYDKRLVTHAILADQGRFNGVASAG